MARQLRVSFPGAIYHIISRGNKRQPIFLCDADRLIFLDILESIIKHYNWICHSYCLMDNHYHLMIETREANLSVGMQRLNGLYSQKFNKKHNTVGHVFQGRFQSILLERESYLLELCRYIVLNPVRAKMIEHPKDYFWSSFRATCGLERSPSYLTVDWVLSQFHDLPVLARALYHDFVVAGIEQNSNPSNTKNSVILGSEKFLETVKKFKILTKEVPIKQLSQLDPDLHHAIEDTNRFNREDRNHLIRNLYYKHRYKMIELAKAFELHYSTVSKIIKEDING